MPSPPHTLQACLTPTKTSCQADASACSSGQVCCPLTKVRSPHEAPPLRSRNRCTPFHCSTTPLRICAVSDFRVSPFRSASSRASRAWRPRFARRPNTAAPTPRFVKERAGAILLREPLTGPFWRSRFQHCLTPTAPGKFCTDASCATNEVCCPLTKLCVKVGAECTAP
jgi:hypothetical protein